MLALKKRKKKEKCNDQYWTGCCCFLLKPQFPVAYVCKLQKNLLNASWWQFYSCLPLLKMFYLRSMSADWACCVWMQKQVSGFLSTISIWTDEGEKVSRVLPLQTVLFGVHVHTGDYSIKRCCCTGLTKQNCSVVKSIILTKLLLREVAGQSRMFEIGVKKGCIKKTMTCSVTCLWLHNLFIVYNKA